MDHLAAHFSTISSRECPDPPAFEIGDDVRLFGGHLRWRVAGRSWDAENACTVYDLERSGCNPMFCTERAIRPYDHPGQGEVPEPHCSQLELEAVA